MPWVARSRDSSLVLGNSLAYGVACGSPETPASASPEAPQVVPRPIPWRAPPLAAPVQPAPELQRHTHSSPHY